MQNKSRGSLSTHRFFLQPFSKRRFYQERLHEPLAIRCVVPPVGSSSLLSHAMNLLWPGNVGEQHTDLSEFGSQCRVSMLHLIVHRSSFCFRDRPWYAMPIPRCLLHLGEDWSSLLHSQDAGFDAPSPIPAPTPWRGCRLEFQQVHQDRLVAHDKRGVDGRGAVLFSSVLHVPRHSTKHLQVLLPPMIPASSWCIEEPWDVACPTSNCLLLRRCPLSLKDPICPAPPLECNLRC